MGRYSDIKLQEHKVKTSHTHHLKHQSEYLVSRLHMVFISDLSRIYSQSVQSCNCRQSTINDVRLKGVYII